MKKIKAPFADLTDYLKAVGSTIESLDIDMNEWEIDGKKGVSLIVSDGTIK